MANDIDNALDTLKQALGKLEQSSSQSKTLEFDDSGDLGLYGKGLIWKSDSTMAKLILAKPQRIYSTESFDIAQGKSYCVNGNEVLSETSLGSCITTSKLREVGRLKDLIVDGSVNIGNYIIYDYNTNRIGIGTDTPHHSLSVAEDGIEVVIGSMYANQGKIGTYANYDLEIVTDNTPRLSIKANGNVVFGSVKPAQVTINGKLSVGVNNPDPMADIHTNGPIRFNNRIHMMGDDQPHFGNYRKGDIMWNENPQVGGTVGWVCVASGDPGVWAPFGKIG